MKRQPRPTEVFLEIKAWGAWNGPWIPYIYEPVDVPGAKPEDLNDIIARYRNTTKGPRIVEAALAVPAARWAELFGQAIPQRESTLGMALHLS